MVKKILKIAGIAVASIVAIIVILSVVIMIVVDKKLVADQVKKALNRQVVIGDVSIGIFAIISGIHVKDVQISNFKTEQQLKALEGKPIAKGDLFVSVKDIALNFKFLPLLQKRFELKKFILHGPTINIVRSDKGTFNFDDLLQPKKLTPEEKAEEEKKKAEEAKEGKKPFTADDIPIAVTVGEAGIDGGTVTYTDQKFAQTFQVYNLTAKVHSIEIDPKELDKKNNVKIYINMGIKTVGAMKTGTVNAFDLGFKATGNAKPFDLKTKKIDPEVSIEVKLPYGNFNGLKLFEKLASLGKLTQLFGGLPFMKGNVQWKDSPAHVDAWYKAGLVKLSNGDLKNSDFTMNFSGEANTNVKTMNMKIDMVLSDKRSGAIKNGIKKNVEAGLRKLGAKKYVKADKAADNAVRPLLNKNGKVYFTISAVGPFSDPNVNIVQPQIASLDEIIKSVAGDVAKGAVMDAGGKLLKDAGKKIKIPKLF
ncbi:MAG: AsmA family protein [Spirochaetes bacterium]|jgi:hypothetical protein|nr:AsmA family protein [Spirochaetota bacterium]